jgi:hypothetical protein
MKTMLSSTLLLVLSVTGAAAQSGAAVAGAVAGVSASKAVSTCLKHPILCGAAAAVGVVALKSMNRDRNVDLATARQREAVGQPVCTENLNTAVVVVKSAQDGP